MEPIRPRVDRFLLNWILHQPLRRGDFFEMSNGNCRLMAALCVKLSETAPAWARAVAPIAEEIVRALWTKPVRQHAPATRLTQRHRREAKGHPSFPAVVMSKPECVCRYCGRNIRRGKRYCSECAVTATHENFGMGRKSAQQPESLAKRSATQRLHKQAIQNWESSELPSWLTRDLYVKLIQPALAKVAKSQIRSALAVSEPYSSNIQAGRRIPHPRHWQALAQLVGVTPSADWQS